MQTILLDRSWNPVVDSAGNIAVASEPYSQAQDAASEAKLFLGEAYYETTRGVPYWQRFLGMRPPVALVKAKLVSAALLVPGVVAARAFVTSLQGRLLTGQLQITNQDGTTGTARF
jgi:hypothetical protein